MGWAIKRADGTYRSWNANLDVVSRAAYVLASGEIWEELDNPPKITPSPPTVSDNIEARLRVKDYIDRLPEWSFRAFLEVFVDELNAIRSALGPTFPLIDINSFKTAMKDKINKYNL